MRRWCFYAGRIFVHTWKLLLRGKETWILLGVGIFLLFSMLFSMDEVKEEKSRIVVGIADEDGSEFSGRVILRLKELDGYEIIEGKAEELLLGLTTGEYSVVCVLREGYEEHVRNADTDDLVFVYETEQKALLFTDVLAGAMIEEICSAKSYRLFQEYMIKKDGVFLETPEEYSAYMEKYFSKSMFDFSFDVEYVSVSGEESKKPGNEIIYLQAIFAIAAMMMGFLAVYAAMPYHRLCHGRMAEKIATLPGNRSAVLFGAGVADLVLTGGFAIVFLFVFVVRNHSTISTLFAFLICTLLYLCVIVGIAFIAATVISSQQAYQIVMMGLVLVFGVFGLISIVDGLILPEGISTWIPNGRYVREMMEIYQK